MRRIRPIALFMLMILCFAVLILPAAAQKLDSTLITEDGAFQLSYPSEWDMEERPDGAIDFESDFLFGTVYPPAYIATGALFPPDYSSAAAMLESFRQASEDAGVVEFTDTSTVTLDSGTEAERGDFEFTQSGANNGSAQFMLSVPVGDAFALILVSGDDVEAVETAIYAMADSFVALEVVTPEDVSPDVPEFGMNFDDGVDGLIEQLEDAGYLTGDGEMVHETEFLSTSAGGVTYLPDEGESTYANFAGGALTSFRPDPDDNICGFLLRTIPEDDDLSQYLFIGLDADYNLLVLEYSETAPDEPSVVEDSSVNFFNPHYLTYVLNENVLTVFVDGNVVISDLEVSLPEADRRGEVDAALVGAELEMSCVMTEYWAYGFES